MEEGLSPPRIAILNPYPPSTYRSPLFLPGQRSFERREDWRQAATRRLAMPRAFLLAYRAVRIYTPTIGAAQAAWSAVWTRCIFSECLNESTLPVPPGAPPGFSAGAKGLRARTPLLNGLAGCTGAALRSALDDLATTVFPSDCRVCGRPLLRCSVLPICDLCRTSVPAQAAAMCRICGEALDLDIESARFASQHLGEGLLCDGCRTDLPMFERAVAYAAYRDELREMVHLLKYERMSGVATLLAPMLANAILTIEAEAAQDLVVVPVPLFPSKRRLRGYNQSELLAKAALAELRRARPAWRLRLEPALMRRRRDTRSQFELSPASRYWNVKSAFEVDMDSIQPGCEVLLIDDIYTTGATARECSRALRRAGASKVWVATLSRAQRPSIQVAMWNDRSSPSAQGFG